MPLYATKCPVCQEEDLIWRRIAERDNLPTCGCGAVVTRVLVAPMIIPEIQPFISPNGEYITSRTEWREDLKKNNAIPLEPGLKEEIAKNLIAEKERAFAPIAQAVDNTVAALVSAGKLET